MDEKRVAPNSLSPAKEPLAWRCSADGKHWAQFAKKRCRYCQPIYDPADLKVDLAEVQLSRGERANG